MLAAFYVLAASKYYLTIVKTIAEKNIRIFQALSAIERRNH
jgi:hypothetical protein